MPLCLASFPASLGNRSFSCKLTVGRPRQKNISKLLDLCLSTRADRLCFCDAFQLQLQKKSICNARLCICEIISQKDCS